MSSSQDAQCLSMELDASSRSEISGSGRRVEPGWSSTSAVTECSGSGKFDNCTTAVLVCCQTRLA